VGLGYALFIEQIPFDGQTSRPTQRTFPINAPSEKLAVNDAVDYIENLFTGVTSLWQITAHLQKGDGTVLRQIIFAREERGRPITTRS
jgi:hypothetical protein